MSSKSSLYKSLVPLSSELHLHWGLESSSGFPFMRNSHSAPISAIEFFLLAKDYPIAFEKSTTGLSVIAILGLRKDENIYMDKDGSWASDTYVPALVRAYPFSLSREATGPLSLYIDESFDKINKESKGEMLFDTTGATTEFQEQARVYLQNLQKHTEFTEQLCSAMYTLNILKPLETRFQTPSGDKSPIEEYWVIDREKLEDLPQQKLGELAKSGFLEPIYLHLNSLSNLATLIKRTRSTKR